MRVLLLCACLFLSSCLGWSVIPRPQQIAFPGGQRVICPASFSFVAPSPSNAILDDNIKRYTDLIFALNPAPTACDPTPVKIEIKLDSLSETLNSKTKENYSLTITSTTCTISAATVFGAIHGMETFAQLIDRSDPNKWVVQNVAVVDAPRFSYRGFLHDTSRHFLPVPTLKKLIDALSAAKMNVLHWHIVDDQSFPYVSKVLPKLSLGSWGGKTWLTYTPTDVAELIKYAKYRGVRVVPEFDTPGHVTAWGVGYPELVTPCYSNGKPNGSTGPLNPSLSSTFTMLNSLWDEIAQTFEDDYVHLGGDEVSFACWASNPNVNKFMQEQGFGNNYAKLEQYYEQNLIKIIEKTNKNYVVWQEVFDNGLDISHNTIVDVWKGGNWTLEAAKVTAAGYQSILSAPFYLNYISDPYYGDSACGDPYVTGDWCQYYIVDPQGFPGTPAQKQLMIGGEGCMWGEYTSPANVETNTWPRAAAVAERLWSNETVRDVADMGYRLQGFTCELNRRGIRAQPVGGPSYCDYQPLA